MSQQPKHKRRTSQKEKLKINIKRNMPTNTSKTRSKQVLNTHRVLHSAIENLFQEMKILSSQSSTASKIQRDSYRLRVVKPPKDITAVSNHHWNQISQQLANSTTSRQTNRNDGFKNHHKHSVANVTSATTKPFSFLSNICGKDMMMRFEKESIITERMYFPRNKYNATELVKSRLTIVTDADVDAHEFGIQERRIHRKNMMCLTTRATSEYKRKPTRPSSSKHTRGLKQASVMQKKDNQSKMIVSTKTKRRPVSANPKLQTISGRNRPLSAQIKMGDKKLENESMEGDDKEYEELNINEISEVPRFDEIEEEHMQTEQRKLCDKIMNTQHTTATVFNHYKDIDLPYPELFDRTERTIAACYAKLGNLSHFTAVQRIGCYMDFSSRLKRKHLYDIIQYLKHNNIPQYDEDKLDENFNENCLFIGQMPDEDPENERMTLSFNRQDKVIQLLTDESPNENEVPHIIYNVYDPGSIMSEFCIPNSTLYSKKMIREMEVSLDRYKHYIEDPDGIRSSEISKYNKDWMTRALDMIYPNFLLKSYTEKIRELFQEILANYALAMKNAILNYILRSPIERKRLHILMIPREVPTSSTKIALRGGYSTKIYEEWHKTKKDAEAEVKIKMICNNIVMGSLVNWWYDFRDIKLFKFQGIKEFCNMSGNRLTFDSFIKILTLYKSKTKALLKDIWYRGAIMIIKKF